MDTLKHCHQCNQDLPRSAFSPDKDCKDGLQGHCKNCHKQYGKRAATNPIEPDWNSQKKCTQCGEIKIATEFYREKRDRSTGLSAACKTCFSAKDKAFREANPERVRQKKRKEYERHAERYKTKTRQWYIDNKQRSSDYHKQYAIDHVEARREYERERRKLPQRIALKKLSKHRRRSRELNIGIDFTRNDWEYALEYFGHSCAVCGRLVDENDTAVGFTLAGDHWHPLSKGGATTKTNIVPLCHARSGKSGGCNNRKHDKEPEKWLSKEYEAKEAAEIHQRILNYFAHITVPD